MSLNLPKENDPFTVYNRWRREVNKELGDISGGTDTDAIHDNVAGEINAIAAKTTPADNDVVIIEDSAATYAKKKLSWTNIKATLKTYFDTLYAAVHSRLHSITSADDHTSTATAGQMLKADANGLPVDATNTDAAVAAVVSASHIRSHTMTSSSDHSATNWRVFYSNGSGVVTELALGASGTYLKSNGASAAPSFAAGAGGGLAYSDFGDLAAYSFAAGDLTIDGNWHDLDLTAAGVSADSLVHLNVTSNCDYSGYSVRFRKNGNSNVINAGGNQHPVANQTTQGDIFVKCDANKKIEYCVGNTTWNFINIAVRGEFV